uniref:Uncharacterized protein n=1 Tax=viral metagenome TaxID=1070528 RepID=A0A6C0HMR5_9ZZZZ
MTLQQSMPLDTLNKIISYLPDYITKNVTQNYKYITLSFVLSFAFLFISNYMLQRYMKNVSLTTNKFYTKHGELTKQVAIKHLNTQKIYTFWNGNRQSTYHLIMLLKQGYIVQSLYIEEYTILKGIDNEKLAELVAKYKASIKDLKKNLKTDKQLDSYMTYLKKIKIKQNRELDNLMKMRLAIKSQFSEYEANFLPTMYITAITKDMIITNAFASKISEMSPIYEDHFEVIEQMIRFAQHFTPQENSYAVIDIPLTIDSNSATTFQAIVGGLYLDKENTQSHTPLNILKLPRTPILINGLDKEKIKIIAMEQRFYNILQISES